MPTTFPCQRCDAPVEPDDRFCRRCGRAQPPAIGSSPGADEVLQAVPFGLFTADGGGIVTSWNRVMETLTGKEAREVLGASLERVLPQLAGEIDRILLVLDSGLPLRLDPVTHETARGHSLTEAFWFGRIERDRDEPSLLGIMEDITYRVRVDTQLIRSERLAAIGELAAGVAHNFNNILASIGGDAQLLALMAEGAKLAPEVVAAARQISAETMRGGRIAHDLLSFARGGPPTLQRLDLAVLVDDTARLLRNHPSARAVSFEVRTSSTLPHVEADPNLLHQIFFNLMLNALQAMPGGGVLTIHTAARSDANDPDRGLLDLTFRDTGTGIPREDLRRVFDPFYSRRVHGPPGTGLGLPVSLAMVRSMGGDIQISSEEGVGTSVTVTLPIIERRNAPRQRRTAREERAPKGGPASSSGKDCQ